MARIRKQPSDSCCYRNIYYCRVIYPWQDYNYSFGILSCHIIFQNDVLLIFWLLQSKSTYLKLHWNEKIYCCFFYLRFVSINFSTVFIHHCSPNCYVTVLSAFQDRQLKIHQNKHTGTMSIIQAYMYLTFGAFTAFSEPLSPSALFHTLVTSTLSHLITIRIVSYPCHFHIVLPYRIVPLFRHTQCFPLLSSSVFFPQLSPLFHSIALRSFVMFSVLITFRTV